MIKGMIKDIGRVRRILDNYLGDLYPKRISVKNIFKYKTFFPFWDSCEIEINSFCNRDCKFCPRYMDKSGIRKTQDGRKVKKEMPTQKVYDLIDELERIGYKGIVRFGRLSEATLDQRYVEFVSYAKSKGLSVREPTNGDILRNNPELCAKLDGLVDRLVIGIYDAENEDKITEQKELFRQRFKKTELRFSIPFKNFRFRQGAKIYAKYPDKKRDVLSWPCLCMNKRKLLIRYDGEVSLCCEDDVCSFELGNVFSRSISEIWWSEKHRRIISDLRQRGGKLKYKRCSRCYRDMERLDFFDAGM